MRIASTQYHTTMNTALQTASARLENVMQQMASGQRLLQPSDDPVTSVRLSRLTREEAAIDQYRINIAALKTRLQLNESHLTSMSKDMLQARDLLVWAADGGNTPMDANAMAGSLRSLRDSLFYTANIKDQEGHYLFSGTLADTATIIYDATQPLGSRYSFAGNDGVQQVMVGNGITQSANVGLRGLEDLLNRLDETAVELAKPGADVNGPALRSLLTATIDGLDTTLGSVSAKITGLGGEQNILQTLDDNHANVSLSNKKALIDLGQLDYGDAAVKLNGYTSALQATQKAYGKVSALSLFDVL